MGRLFLLPFLGGYGTLIRMNFAEKGGCALLRRILCSLVAALILCTAASAASSISEATADCTVAEDGACTVTTTVVLQLEESLTEISLPVAQDAKDAACRGYDSQSAARRTALSGWMCPSPLPSRVSRPSPSPTRARVLSPWPTTARSSFPLSCSRPSGPTRWRSSSILSPCPRTSPRHRCF